MITGLSTLLKTNFAYTLKADGPWSQNRHTQIRQYNVRFIGHN